MKTSSLFEQDASEFMPEKIMKALKRRLRDGQHTVLYASRGVDKAALVFNAVKSFSKKENISVIYIDLWTVSSFSEMATSLMDTYLSGDGDLRSAKHTALSGGEFLIMVISSILERELLIGNRVLLFIDEFQRLSKFEDMTISESDCDELGSALSSGLVFLRRLRALLQNQRNVILFASGSDESIVYLFGEYQAPFYKGALPLKIEGNEQRNNTCEFNR